MDFSSTLIIKSPSKSDIALSYTSKIIFDPRHHSVYKSNFSRYIYYYSDNKLSVYRLFPYTLINEITYKQAIEDICFIKDFTIILSDKMISIQSSEGAREINGNFAGCRLFDFDGKLVIKYPQRIEIYNLDALCYKDDFVPKIYPCTAFSTVRDVLVLSFNNKVSIFIKDDLKTSFFLNNNVALISVDKLVTNLYFALDNNDIMCYPLCGRKPNVLKYHKEKIVGLAHSFCGKFVYSCDEKGLICVWDGCVVIDKVNIESEIECMSVVYCSDSSASDDLPLIKYN